MSLQPHPLESILRTAVMCVLVLAIASELSLEISAQEVDSSAEAIALFNAGQDAHEKGDFTTAIQNYEKALKSFPEFPEAELQRGSAYLSIGNPESAEAAFRKAVELRDDWSLALANLGGVLVRVGKFGEAEKFLTKAIELDENNFPAYAAMTELRLQTKADTKILNTLLARLNLITLKANPTASIWASRAALEIAVGDIKLAKQSAGRALQLDPRSQFALSTSAEIALRENDPASADGFVTRLEAISPRSESVKALRSRVLVAQDRTRDAIALLNSIEKPGQQVVELKNQIAAGTLSDPAELERQVAAQPTNATVLSKLCTAYRTSDPVKAIEFCRRAAEVAPQSIEPVIGYAAALLQAKRYDQSVVVLRKVVEIAPDNSTARANLGTALFQLKRYAEAKIEFQWLTQNRPDIAAAHYFLGIVHDQLGEYADAAANYHQFLRVANAESSKLEIEKVNLRLPIIQNLIKEGKGKKRD